MKVSVNDKELFTLTDLQKQVILNDLHCETEEELIADLSRRLHWVLILEKHDKCLGRLITDWQPKLAAEGIAIPPVIEDAVKLILSHPEYKNRVQREAEATAVRQKLAEEAAVQRAEEEAEKQKLFNTAVQDAVAQALATRSTSDV